MASRIDLHSYLAELSEIRPEAILEIDRPLSVAYDMTSLQVQLAAQNKCPVMLVKNPVRVDGTPSPFPIALNVTASRELLADSLGMDPRQIAKQFTSRTAGRIEPAVVSADQAPVKEVVQRGDEVNLLQFPMPIHQHLDPGPYLSGGFVTTYDPDTGVDNTAIQRMWAKGPNRLGYYPVVTSHGHANMRKWWARGEDMPVAIWIGHHPSVMMGASARLSYPESHWAAAGGLIGSPVRLVPTELFGDRLMVPADAEIVLEGHVLRDVWEAEGPYGEFLGYVGSQRPGPIIAISCITHRRQAILHDFASGLSDTLMLGNIPLEARLYETLKRVVPDVVNVHVPLSGRRFHTYIQVRKTRASTGRDAIYAGLGADPRPKHFVVVDEDVDIFDDRAVLWAIATRTQWDQDVIIAPKVTASALDPSLPGSGAEGAKGGIDATLPLKSGPRNLRPFPVANCMPPGVEGRVRVEEFVNPEQLIGFPNL